MYLNSTGYYIPAKRMDNKYFSALHGVDEEWFEQRTGMHTRSRALENETIDYMGVKAVEKAIDNLIYDPQETDLIIFASYTPSDTISTTGHIIQKEYNMSNAKVFHLSSGCSSAINGMEIINSFFKTGISSKALLVCAERNSTYANDHDIQSGHLWGDAAVCFFFSSQSIESGEAELIDITSQGLAHIGMGPGAVCMKPKEDGLKMPNGKDVFIQACTYMYRLTKDIVKRNGYKIEDLNYFIGHQANQRILNRVCNSLEIPHTKSLTNLKEYGNTGCVGALLVFAENLHKFKAGDLIGISVFGGGYSTGSCLFVMN